MNFTKTIRPWRSVVAVIASLTLVSIALPAPLTLAAGTLTAVGWNVSNSQTGAANVTYSFDFKTATGGQTLDVITMTMPNNTAGTPVVTANYGITASSGVTLTGCPGACLLTYTVNAPVSVAANLPIYIEISGMTNAAAAGSPTSLITTKKGAGVTVDSGTSNSVTFNAGGVATTIAVAKSTVYSMDVNTFNLQLDPAVATSATQALNIGVSSNARLGYTLNCKVDMQPTSGAVTLTSFNANMAAAAAWASGGAGRVGYALSVTNNGAAGAPAPGGTLSVTNFAGFTVAGENCGSATSATGNALGGTSALVGCTGQTGLCDQAAHYWLMTVKAAADYTTQALTYTDTITLTVTPSY